MLGLVADTNLWEVNDHFAHPLSEVSQYADGWLFGYPEGGLVEKYLSGNVGVAFRRVEASCGEPIKDGLIIYRPTMDVQMRVQNREMGHIDRWFQNQQAFVLPQDVELMEDVQQRIASTVCPCVFDRGSFDGADPLFGFKHRYGVQKIGMNGADGEVSLTLRFWCVARKHGVHENVQGCTGGVDDCPDIAKDQGIERLDLFNSQQFPSWVVRIGLHDRFVWATPLPGYESLLEHWDMGYGPIDGIVGFS